MQSLAHANPFSAIDPDAGRVTQPAGADDQGAPATSVIEGNVDVYVPETQIPVANEAATTREELEVSSAAGSTDDVAPGTPPRGKGKQSCPLDLTPSTKDAQSKTHAQRSASLGSANAMRWAARGDTRGPAPQIAMSGIPTDYTVHSAAPGNGQPQFRSSLAVHQERFVTGSGIVNAASTSLPSRPLGAPRTRAGIHKTPALPGIKALLDEQTASATKQFIKSEPLADYLRREPISHFASRIMQRPGSPSRMSASSHIEEFSARPQPAAPQNEAGSAGSSQIDEPTARPIRQASARPTRSATPSVAEDFSSRPPYPFAQPQPRFSRSPTPGPFEHVPPQLPNDMDRMSISDEGDPADDLYDQQPHVVREPRPSGIAVHGVSMTEKIISIARRIAAELAFSTVPVNACGDASPIDGLQKNSHVAGVPPEYIDYHLTKVGDNLIIELWSINGRRAHLFSTDDQIAYMHHILDRMFLQSFPDACIELSLLFTPPDVVQRNAPRARPCLFMASKMHPRQKQILRSARFWTAAGANFTTHGVTEDRSKYTTAVGGLRCASLLDATAFIKTTLRTAPPLKDMLSKKLDEEDDPDTIQDVLNHIAGQRITVTERKVRPPGHSSEVTQYSIYADVYGIIDEEDLPAFELAMRRVTFSHPDFGVSSYFVWECSICHAISHEAAACEAHTVLRWPLLQDQQPGRNNHREQAGANATRRGGFQPGRR
ncbi:hypothetical protein AURDEDRAFT_177123 [Auricularia subglabra TFB-10046 SS5]|uniref:Uncharacterized protein n=1 Tax=Auricularia subglabra (strain TFB-10046 / SS5) TaxID=717982 RepID=J0WN58_AURST|nr:hypothetical protein AURDEDRAFT_177123 [Auricularia subglabra TFB-10046 SS5]